MEHIPSEVPPSERRKPVPGWVKNLVLTVLVVIAAILVGSTLKNAHAGQLLAGSLLLLTIGWLVFLGSRSGDLGTDGHGRRDTQFPGDDPRGR